MIYGHPKADYQKFYCKRRTRIGFMFGFVFGGCGGVIAGYLLKIYGG